MSDFHYVPRPIDASAVHLAPALIALTEQLAENTHDLWAQERMAQGWSWGPVRDDGSRTHPCLVPYAALSEAEKKFDRETAMGTLRAIIALGYVISSPTPPTRP